MAFRIGISDIVAAGVVLAALLLPEQSKRVLPLYEGEQLARTAAIAQAQAELAKNPDDMDALVRLTELSVVVGQSDLGLRAGGAAAARGQPQRWRADLAVSVVHAERLEVQETYDWAKKALDDCDAAGADCPDHQRGRLELYARAIKAGLDSGIDPRLDPDGFKAAVDAAIPMIRIKK